MLPKLSSSSCIHVVYVLLLWTTTNYSVVGGLLDDVQELYDDPNAGQDDTHSRINILASIITKLKGDPEMARRSLFGGSEDESNPELYSSYQPLPSLRDLADNSRGSSIQFNADKYGTDNVEKRSNSLQSFLDSFPSKKSTDLLLSKWSSDFQNPQMLKRSYYSYPSRRSCDYTRLTAEHLVEYLRSGRICGRRVSNMRFGLTGRK